MYYHKLVFILLIGISIADDDINAESEITQLCPPTEQDIQSSTNDDIVQINQQNYCNCDIKINPPWSKLAIKTECRDKGLNNSMFKVELLQFGTILLDMSWNNFNYVPPLDGDQLQILIISNNNVTTIDDHNFNKLPNLQQLDLNFNKIHEISMNAFDNLQHLIRLDLSNNNLKIINSNVFSTLPSLVHLQLNNNYNLHQLFDQNDVNLFLTLGVTPSLKVLEINKCQLTTINLVGGVGLEEIYLKSNNFTIIPQLPKNIEKLVLSDNPIENLRPKFLPHLYRLHTLFLEDMPYLINVEAYALYGLPRLLLLSFEGSKNLTSFHPLAFGENVALNETDISLEILNFRGANLRTLNSTLKFALENILTLELDGNPIICDCDIKWLLSLNIETNAQCQRPPSLRGKRLSDLTEQRLECKRWSTWWYKLINGLFILLLLVVCGISIYLIVLGVKPSRRQQLQKLSSASPYSRITSINIEPNRAENTNL